MAQKNRTRELPIDQGWSWVICFAVVSTSVLVPAFGERPVIIVAGALFAACSIGYYLAPNIIVFIVFAGGKGSCVGLIFVPSVSLLSYYFNKRRSLATTISNSGICVASIVSPPVIRAITAEFGMRGTFLILSAIEFHMVAAGLLMRPVSSYRAVSRDITGLTNIDATTPLKDEPVKEQHAGQSLLSPTSTQDTENELPPLQGDIITKYSNGRLYDMVDSHVSDVPSDDTKNARFYEVGKELANGELLTQTGYPKNTKSKHPHEARKASNKDLLPKQSSRKDSADQMSIHGSNWSIDQKLSGPFVHRDSIMSVTSGLEPGVTGVALHGAPAEDDSRNNHDWRSCCCIRIIRKIFDPSLFRQLAFRVFLVSAVPSATTQYLMQYVPTIAVIKGASKDQAATLLTITGSVDLVSRLAIGFFADTNLLRATQIVAIAQICQGILLQFNTLFDNFEKMIAMVVIMGLFIGTRQSLLPMMHIEIVGMEKMARCLSITAMLATISAACHSPMLSAILEATGSYDIVLYYVGVALIVGAVLMLFMPMLAKVDARRQARKMAA
ncbi:unnamed protein product [Candidula unifasciata]|uniref:Monocarboxylate transporter n=1 Tax=Candidula unifasciata TaxID=100452 RepID=A0A8S3YU88_9EUPU|nr:unnamed protein product [Candidula unifasciata]